ncbi:MAG: arylamine N-acetyltransferase [Bacteroidetes bacterium]|nr:arylamine N-acetyltransferase [Bacteroidota bacterium]MBS1739737.1 arylamine N-acetyltransferase [Bacteroidota bacterium]
MDVRQYLDRIHYVGSTKVCIETLSGLLRQHVFNIPFENVDIQKGIPIILQEDLLFDKIVHRKRGGYCYELNGLFSMLLNKLGFDISLVSGRVVKGKRIGDEFDHLAILVRLGRQQWLVDVGFGDFALIPLSMNTEAPQWDGRNHYCITPHDTDYCVMKQKNTEQSARIEYLFSTKNCLLSDFFPANEFKQSSVESHFTQNLICSLPTQDGRISIINQHLISTVGEIKKESFIPIDDLPKLLSKYFNVHIDELPLKSATKHAFRFLQQSYFQNQDQILR